jgi:hypothetical protein
MFIFGLSEKEDWFFNTFYVYQKVNQDVYCYVSRMIGFYTVQMYERSTTGLCTLEARSESNMEGLFQLGEKWLEKYETWDMNEICKDPYYIGQINHKEICWI